MPPFKKLKAIANARSKLDFEQSHSFVLLDGLREKDILLVI